MLVTMKDELWSKLNKVYGHLCCYRSLLYIEWNCGNSFWQRS